MRGRYLEKERVGGGDIDHEYERSGRPHSPNYEEGRKRDRDRERGRDKETEREEGIERKRERKR